MKRLPIITTWLRTHLRHTSQPLRIAAALAMLLLVGAGVVIAAPKDAPTAQVHTLAQFGSDETPADTATAAIAVTATTSASTPTATDVPNASTTDPTATTAPSDDPQPTATPSGDTPTATPTEPPAPTATSTPSGPRWHTVGSYSGDTLQAVVTLRHVTGPVRVQWTCTVPDGVSSWHFGVYLRSVGNRVQVGQGVLCGPGGTSGTFSYNPQYIDNGGDFIVSVDQAAHATVGPWTLTIEAWY